MAYTTVVFNVNVPLDSLYRSFRRWLVNWDKGQFHQASSLKRKEKDLTKNHKTEDTEVLGRQRAKPSKIKARHSRPTCKNFLYLCAVCTIIIVHTTVAQIQFLLIFPSSRVQTNMTSQRWPSGGKVGTSRSEMGQHASMCSQWICSMACEKIKPTWTSSKMHIKSHPAPNCTVLPPSE